MRSQRPPQLIVFGGLPGTGKTTISSALAGRIGAVYLRIDAIEQAMRNGGVQDVGPTGYGVANAIAQGNLRLGHGVVVDCVNPVAESRKAWHETATRAAAHLIEIELACSDRNEHRRRVRSRASDIAGHRYPTWQETDRFHYEPWGGDHMVFDTAGLSPDEVVERVLAHVVSC
jgi:predicted kinase